MTIYTPLIDALKRHADEGRLGFHTPGHQNGRGLSPAFFQFISRYSASVDLTELEDLDNLAAPAAAIARSQEAMARAYGSRHAYYMVNGASGGLLAAILAMSGPDVPVLIPAHSHISVFQGMILTGAKPMIMPGLIDNEWRLPVGVDYSAMESCLPVFTDGALWVSQNPTYHGVMADLAREKALHDKTGGLWLVDEAHGAHLSAVSRGLSALGHMADVIAHSAHKMGLGFTQTGILHCNQDSVAPKLRETINMLQTTSPSYVLLASLDAWQAYLSEDGADRLKQTDSLALELSERIRALGVYRLWRDEIDKDYAIDPRKITLSAAELGINGVDLAEILRREYLIDAELARDSFALLIVNPGHTPEDIARLSGALRDIKERSAKSKRDPLGRAATDSERRAGQAWAAYGAYGATYSGAARGELIKPAISPREAFFKARELIPVNSAVGRLSAGFVTPYPPGIPLLFPGMEINNEIRGAILERVSAPRIPGQSCAGIQMSGNDPCIEVVIE